MRRKHNKQSQRTREELDLVKEQELERFERGRAERERADAERRAWLSLKHLPARAGGDSPPVLGETDPLVRAPLKPKPHLRSGAIALPERNQKMRF